MELIASINVEVVCSECGEPLAIEDEDDGKLSVVPCNCSVEAAREELEAERTGKVENLTDFIAALVRGNTNSYIEACCLGIKKGDAKAVFESIYDGDCYEGVSFVV